MCEAAVCAVLDPFPPRPSPVHPFPVHPFPVHPFPVHPFPVILTQVRINAPASPRVSARILTSVRMTGVATAHGRPTR
jgi:hypothetical protein